MSIVGYKGGGLILQMGSEEDMLLFFDCLRKVLPLKCPEQDWSLLTNRLFKRYIHQEEAEEANRLMQKALDIFVDVPTQLVKDLISKRNLAKSELDFTLDKLSNVFGKYFRGFFECYEMATIDFETFNNYKPIRTAKTSIPETFYENDRSLSEYDALGPDDPPFWCR